VGRFILGLRQASLIVIRSVIGMQKTVVYSVLVVAMAMLCGMIYGALQS